MSSRSHSLGYGLIEKRGWRVPFQFFRRDRDPCIDGDHAVRVRQERIDVEFPHFRQVCGELSDLDEQERDGTLVGGGNITVGFQDASHTRAADQIVCEPQIEGRERQRFVVNDLDRGPSLPEHDYGTEGRIVR